MLCYAVKLYDYEHRIRMEIYNTIPTEYYLNTKYLGVSIKNTKNTRQAASNVIRSNGTNENQNIRQRLFDLPYQIGKMMDEKIWIKTDVAN